MPTTRSQSSFPGQSTRHADPKQRPPRTDSVVRPSLRHGLLCAALSLSAGCDQANVFSCSDDSSCGAAGAAGRCEPSGFCSFDDQACPSGRRFGTLAGEGLADECVAGSPSGGSSTGDPEPWESTGSAETGQDTTSGGADIEDAPGSSESTGDWGSSSAGATSSSGGSEASSTSAGEDGCAVFEFESGNIPFVAQSVSTDVEIAGGQMLASWPPHATGSALFEVAQGVDLTLGVLDVTFAGWVDLAEGTTASLRWTDPSGRIIAAVLDGGSYAVSYYDPTLPQEEQVSVSVYPVDGRDAVQLATQGESIVVNAGHEEPLETLTAVTGSFDLTDVDVGLLFERYAATGETASLGLASLSLCAD